MHMEEITGTVYIYIYIRRRYNEETKFSVTPSFVLTHSSDRLTFHDSVLSSFFLSDECVSTKLGVTENFVSSLYLLLIQSSTLKSVLSTVLTALATLSHVYIYIYRK